MGSLAPSSNLSPSLTFLQRCNATPRHHSCRNLLHIPSKAKNPNFTLKRHSHSNASDCRTYRDFPKCRVYTNEWSAAYAQQTPQMSQRSAEAEVMGLLLRERIIFLGDEMNDFVADAIVCQLLLLDNRDPKRDIKLFINCPGGSTNAAMAIFDAIQICNADVSTVAFGVSASTASIVLAGGTRGKRLSMPNARIMIHQPMGGASGDTSDVEVQAKEIMFHKKNVIRIYSEITGRPADLVAKEIERDRYMSPLEAVDYGVIDRVIDEDSIMPPSFIPDDIEIPSRPDLRLMEEDYKKFNEIEIPDDEIY